MQFRVVSHAGLLVRGSRTSLLCDPWLVGSAYWRSWWNYPPVSRELVESLRPDSIYLTHIHWDHFHGVSLRRFDVTTPVYVPKSPSDDRILRDLVDIGFRNVVELDHGASATLDEDLAITSYHFGICPDSVLVVECGGVTLINVNDAKIMGLPLKQVIDRHSPVDFVLRSHSSANSRLCYQIIGDPSAVVDDLDAYARDFSAFARATGARHAIPFASNHCYLHDESYRFNESVTTPAAVADYCARQSATPPVTVMLSGDRWRSDTGFEIQDNDYFTHRAERVRAYRDSQLPKLRRRASEERLAGLDMAAFERYFSSLFDTLPFALRLAFRGTPVTWVLRAGDRRTIVETDFYRRSVRQLDDVRDDDHSLQVHTSLLIVQRCVSANLFSLLPISKRVRYRMTASNVRRVHLLKRIFNLYERGYLPLRKTLTMRFLVGWFRRWRELVLYAQIVGNRLAGRRFRMTDYLPSRSPVPGSGDMTVPASKRLPGVAAQAGQPAARPAMASVRLRASGRSRSALG